MNEQDFQLLSRYLDGELNEIAARQLERRLEAEPELRATLDEMSGLERRLKQAFAGTDETPEAVAAMLRPASNVVSLTPRKQRPAWHYAVAASLVAAVGALLAPQWQQNSATEPTLAEVLEQSPAMAEGWQTLADGSSARPVLSFQSLDGSWCREYLLKVADEGQRGVACREAGQWTTRIVAAAELPGSASEFRPAGAGDADAVADFLAEHAAGIALGAAEEQALIENHWQ